MCPLRSTMFSIFPIRLLVLIFVFIYGIIPAVLFFYPWIAMEVVFKHRVPWPPFANYDNVSSYGLFGESFRLQSTDSVELGVWSLWRKLDENTDKPVIIYFHGNMGSRATPHRLGLYKVLTSAGYDLITFDYRGYGDSSSVPTEQGMVDDGETVLRWVSGRYPGRSIVFWGHSLGTAIAVQLTGRLGEASPAPRALILESPFTNISTAALSHPVGVPFWPFPSIIDLIVDAIRQSGIRLETDADIVRVKKPLLILHAKDDWTVPFHLGFELFQIAQRTNGDKTRFLELETGGHRNIFLEPGLVESVENFLVEFTDQK